MNTSTQVSIYNMALAAVGVSRFVQGVDEGSNEANVLNVFWEAARDQCLEEFPWGFAMRYAELALISKKVQGWLHCYKYPSDCLQTRLIMPTIPMTADPTLFSLGYLSSGIPFDYWSLFRSYKHIPFTVIEDETGGGLAIATSIETPTLVYTARIMTIPLWSPSFVNALSWLLASKIAAPLSASPEYATIAGQAYEAAILKAGANSLNEGKEKPQPESELILARN